MLAQSRVKERKGWEEPQTSREGGKVVWSHDWGEFEKVDFMRFVAYATKVWEGPCRAGPSLPEYRTRMIDCEGKKERKRRPTHR